MAVVVVIALIRNLTPPDTAPAAAPSSTTEIQGTITIAPELAGRVGDGSVLFIIARKGPGPPFAAKRVVGPHFPLAYRLGPDDVMLAGSPFEGEVRMSARLSRTGSAGPAQPGDLEGEHPVPVRPGADHVDMTISHVH